MKRHDHEQMLSLYDQWQASGESKTEFAVNHGIRPTTFYYWARKFEQSGSGSGFRRISLDEAFPEHRDEPLATIHYPTGVRLELYTSIRGGMSSPEIELLKKLIN